jgi:ubiquitin-conjugating enzyme E2 J2
MQTDIFPICLKRLTYELKRISNEPLPGIIVKPDDANIRIWYFLFYNMTDEYKGGQYLGKIVFDNQYPFKAPTIEFLTPNGRFDVNIKICTTFTHFHPEEWTPEWSVGSLLVGLMSFMYEPANNNSVGSIITTEKDKKRFAMESIDFNKKLKEFTDNFRLY